MLFVLQLISWREFISQESLCRFFLFLVFCLILLRCIIRDAEEDLEALKKLRDGSETHIGNPDEK